MTDLVEDADVLVIGGGPAGCWAAIAAAGAGARVVLVDKGYCGSSGAAAAAGHGVWYVPPDPEMREEAMASREALGGHLADRTWAARVLDVSFDQVNRLESWGYRFDEGAKNPRRVGKDGHVNYGRGLQGPAYMRLMRRKVTSARVRIRDHSPALELLTTPAGEVVGARGVRRQKGGRWTVRASAVVIATGGCTFLSGGLGCNVLTGEGHLMAAEAGAHFSGMEFSSAYAIAPAFGSVTKTAYYQYASFSYENGSVVEGAGWHSRSPIARALDAGQSVYAVLDKAEPEIHARLRRGQPNFFAPFDRAGIDPFTQRFPVTLRLEGTMRGTGGLHIGGSSCETDVPGLFAAGDVATRELICGGFTGGASHNAAWAIASGTLAGAGAARHARQAGADRTAGRPTATRDPFETAPATGEGVTWREIARAVQGEILPYRKNYFRTSAQLTESLAALDRTWAAVATDLRWTPEDAVHAREAAGMTAVARWMYTAALARNESRGMHKRTDAGGPDPQQRRRLLVGGLDRLWTAPDPVAPRTGLETVAA
ncbi:MAG TPA: FAD-binding protein [Jatrophihabitans sp.]|nr:FAD-binding protein [Jatrophihabitans sp.]